MAQWYLPKNEGGQTKGISDSGIDLFKADPVKSLTREMCQNSIDVRVDKTKPVRMEFDLFEINGNEIPGRDELIHLYEEAYAFVKTQKNFRKADAYFKRTLPILKGQKIAILRISDFNTKGLDGADDTKDWSSGWFRLVRSVSSSDKEEGAIGKYGSGKLSAFVCSDFQTVFYSTKAIKNNIEAYEGVTKLLYFIDSENNTRSDVGYFCEGISEAIFEQAKLQKTFIRSEYGTDIYILGFKYAGRDWEKDIIISLLDGFLYAIMENNLTVSVGSIPVNNKTVGTLIEEYQKELDPHTLDYYKLLTLSENDGVATKDLSFLEENDIVVKMMVKPDLHKRVGIIRYPGMKVFDRGYISQTVSFAGICIIKGKKISDLFGGLENIQHTKWDIKRYDDDPELQTRAKKLQEQLFDTFAKMFNELKGETEGEDLDPDIGDCLPDPFSKEKTEIETISDTVLEIGKPREIKVDPESAVNSTGPDGDVEYKDEGQYGQADYNYIPNSYPPFPGPFPGPIPGPLPSIDPIPGPEIGDEPSVRKIKKVKAKIRVIAIDVQEGTYKIMVTPNEEIRNGIMDIRMGAESDNYKADIISANIDGKPLKIDQSCLNNIYLDKGQKGIIDVKLNYSDLCSLEVHIYEY